MKIAILGASYLQLPLIEKAKANGFETHCFAWDDGRAVCKNISDYFYDLSVLEKKLILEKCQELNIDGILTIATDICIPSISYVVEKMNLIGNSYQTALLTTNKGLMRECFSKHRIASPFYQIIEDFSQLNTQSLDYPLIVKPVDRSGSLGVVKAENEQDLKAAVMAAINYSFSKSCIIEEFIEGKEVSVETITYKSEHQIIAITDKVITKAPYFVEIEHHQPSAFDEETINKISELSLAILDATKVTFGISHIELMVTKKGDVKAIEIGSRMGGDFIGSDLIKLSTGIDFVQVALDCALGKLNFPLVKKENKFSGVYFLSEETGYLLPVFDQGYINRSVVKKEIFSEELLPLRSSNDRSGYIIYQSNQKEYLL